MGLAVQDSSRWPESCQGKSLPYNIGYNHSQRIIELIHKGSLSGEEIRIAADECIKLHFEHNARSILIDIEHIEKAPPLEDVIKLPSQYEEGGMSRATRIAIVVPNLPREEATAHFYVRFCRNRGWLVQKFETCENAIAWLTRTSAS